MSRKICVPTMVIHSEMARSFKGDRVCKYCGCKISMYNKSKVCFPCQRKHAKDIFQEKEDKAKKQAAESKKKYYFKKGAV